MNVLDRIKMKNEIKKSVGNNTDNSLSIKVGDLTKNGLTETDLATAIKNDRSQLSQSKKYSENGNKLYNSLCKMQDGLVTKGIAYGDSITWGQIPITGGQSINNYPAVLQTKLQKIYANSNINIINAGNPGQTTTFALANIDAQVISQVPDFCVMMWGNNDCTARLDLATFKDNIRQMVKKCLTANIEVLLLTCHSVFKSDDSRTNRQQLYAKAVIEVAKELDVVYINMFEETTNLIHNGIEVPIDLFPDMVHFAQNKYFYISDIIITNALCVNEFNKVLEVNNEVVIPIWHSPYIKTDIPATAEYDHPISTYKKTVSIASDTSKGTYLRFCFFNKKKNQKLILVGAKSAGGGKVTILDNGVSANTISFYSSSTATLYDTVNTAVENLSYGLHIIEILNTNIVLGQATTGVGSGYFAAFKIVNTKNIATISYGGNAPFTPEYHRGIIDNTVKFTDSDATKNSQLVFSNSDFVELKTGKTLVIEAQGTFFATSGISWFNNKNSGTFPTGYNTLINGTNLLLYKSDTTSYAQIATAATTFDYTTERTFRITMTETGVITIYIDGTQVLQYTDATYENSGYVGLYSGVSTTGTMTIKRLEYCYI